MIREIAGDGMISQGFCQWCSEVRWHETCERTYIVNLALKPGEPMRKLPSKHTLLGRLQRAWLALTGWELYGA